MSDDTRCLWKTRKQIAAAIDGSASYASTMRFYDLPEIEPGQYGLCFYEDDETHRIHIVEYDEDDFWCSHGLDEKDADHSCTASLADGGDIGKGCYLDYGALITWGPGFSTVPFCALRAFPISMCDKPFESRREGWVYAVALTPDEDLRRIKIGFTAKPIARRIQSFRTTNPRSVLVGLWEADRSDERLAHSTADGRVLDSEVFQVSDILETMRRLDRLLGVRTDT